MTPPRRVGLFVQDLGGGGAERMMLNLAGGMAESGYAVDLVLVRKAGPYVDLIPPTVRVIELETRRTSRSIPALARYMRRESPDALLSTLVHCNIAALLARRLAGTSTRIVIRETNSMARNPGHVPPAVRLAYRLVPWLYRDADSIVAISNGLGAELARVPGVRPHQVRVIHNPVVPETLAGRSAEPVTDPWFGPSTEIPVVVAVGRLVPQKDFPTLLRAVACVRRQRPVRLLILGEGPERSRLTSMVAELGLTDDVRMPGFVSNPFAYMARAAALVLSSRWEGFGSVIVEAMACGTPVIATDCPSGPAEILQDGRFGALVPVGDAVAMGQAVLHVLDHPLPRTALLNRAADFTVSRIVPQYLDVMLDSGRDRC